MASTYTFVPNTEQLIEMETPAGLEQLVAVDFPLTSSYQVPLIELVYMGAIEPNTLINPEQGGFTASEHCRLRSPYTAVIHEIRVRKVDANNILVESPLPRAWVYDVIKNGVQSIYSDVTVILAGGANTTPTTELEPLQSVPLNPSTSPITRHTLRTPDAPGVADTTVPVFVNEPLPASEDLRTIPDHATLGVGSVTNVVESTLGNPLAGAPGYGAPVHESEAMSVYILPMRGGWKVVVHDWELDTVTFHPIQLPSNPKHFYPTNLKNSILAGSPMQLNVICGQATRPLVQEGAVGLFPVLLSYERGNEVYIVAITGSMTTWTYNFIPVPSGLYEYVRRNGPTSFLTYEPSVHAALLGETEIVVYIGSTQILYNMDTGLIKLRKGDRGFNASNIGELEGVNSHLRPRNADYVLPPISQVVSTGGDIVAVGAGAQGIEASWNGTISSPVVAKVAGEDKEWELPIRAEAVRTTTHPDTVVGATDFWLKEASALGSEVAGINPDDVGGGDRVVVLRGYSGIGTLESIGTGVLSSSYRADRVHGNLLDTLTPVGGIKGYDPQEIRGSVNFNQERDGVMYIKECSSGFLVLSYGWSQSKFIVMDRDRKILLASDAGRDSVDAVLNTNGTPIPKRQIDMSGVFYDVRIYKNRLCLFIDRLGCQWMQPQFHSEVKDLGIPDVLRVTTRAGIERLYSGYNIHMNHSTLVSSPLMHVMGESKMGGNMNVSPFLVQVGDTNNFASIRMNAVHHVLNDESWTRYFRWYHVPATQQAVRDRLNQVQNIGCVSTRRVTTHFGFTHGGNPHPVGWNVYAYGIPPSNTYPYDYDMTFHMLDGGDIVVHFRRDTNSVSKVLSVEELTTNSLPGKTAFNMTVADWGSLSKLGYDTASHGVAEPHNALRVFDPNVINSPRTNVATIDALLPDTDPVLQEQVARVVGNTFMVTTSGTCLGFMYERWEVLPVSVPPCADFLSFPAISHTENIRSSGGLTTLAQAPGAGTGEQGRSSVGLMHWITAAGVSGYIWYDIPNGDWSSSRRRTVPNPDPALLATYESLPAGVAFVPYKPQLQGKEVIGLRTPFSWTAPAPFTPATFPVEVLFADDLNNWVGAV